MTHPRGQTAAVPPRWAAVPRANPATLATAVPRPGPSRAPAHGRSPWTGRCPPGARQRGAPSRHFRRSGAPRSPTLSPPSPHRHCACAAAALGRALPHRPLPQRLQPTPPPPLCPALPWRFEYANRAAARSPMAGPGGGHVGRGRVLRGRAPTCPGALKSGRRARKRLSQREKVPGRSGCGWSARNF